MNKVEKYMSEIMKSYKQAKKFRDGYSTLGDRSESFIMLYRSLKTSDDFYDFKQALLTLLKNGDDDFLAFFVDVVSDSIDFGTIIGKRKV